jgi:hypothetical protein
VTLPKKLPPSSRAGSFFVLGEKRSARADLERFRLELLGWVLLRISNIKPTSTLDWS